MEQYFRLIIDKNRLVAKIERIAQVEDDFAMSQDEVIQFLNKEKIAFGIKEEVVINICHSPNSIQYPIVIAEGIPSKDGSNAYLLDEVQKDKKEKREKFNFRNVIEIPSVTSGQVLASIYPPTPGTSGTDVFGHVIPAKNGMPLKIRPGKNVILNGTKFYSTSDGQLSLTSKLISVNPVYEVQGDLDLKTGNINFIGNVVIRGNVPSGYEVIAGGDVKIFGLVEGAIIRSDGNIIISGGVSGGNKGSLFAIGNIQAAYLNQANVESKQDIFVNNSILHSEVKAAGSIFCENALVIGGRLTAGKSIHIKEVGNRLFTKTTLRAGVDDSVIERESALQKNKIELNATFEKLMMIENKLLRIGKAKGMLTAEQKSIILMQRESKNKITQQLKEIDEELEIINNEQSERNNSCIHIYKTAYPNTIFQFGKYAIQLQKSQSSSKYSISNSEIISEPIVEFKNPVIKV
ncbi:uncharacterized protein (DUF342 family) [Cytobacillus eiseniae]|uniref:Uncharacterized protein (DUF342 family) n=1 Tax=Cytobacillus eiseniae TaxID=762947 RepID=A0ABS4RBR1_9BACI|nr:uncharacterized protein (DUF342 family) [Cytobacillus eiseniae]